MTPAPPDPAGPAVAAPANAEQALLTLLHGLGAAWGVKEAASGAYRHVSPALAAWMGASPQDAVGRTDAALFPPAAATALIAADHTAIAQGQPLLSEHTVELAGRRCTVAVWRVVTAPDAEGRRWLHVAWTDRAAQQQRDAELTQAREQVQALQRALEALRQEAAAATGAQGGEAWEGSLARFEEQMRRELDLSTREHREFAVVLIDVDRAETPRPAAADAVGRLLRENTRAMDASCRVDDARFAVLLSGVGLATGHARMESLRRQCATQLVVDGREGEGFTVSMGVASFPHTAKTQEELVAAAERALADAKHKGGNRVSLAAIRFDPA